VFDTVFHERVEDPVFGVSMRNEAGQTVLETTTQWSQPDSGVFEPGETASVRLKLDAWFRPDRYSLTPSVARRGSGSDTLDLREDMVSVILHSSRSTGGLIDPPHTFEIERAPVTTR
jgi:hypothetical protein